MGALCGLTLLAGCTQVHKDHELANARRVLPQAYADYLVHNGGSAPCPSLDEQTSLDTIDDVILEQVAGDYEQRMKEHYARYTLHKRAEEPLLFRDLSRNFAVSYTDMDESGSIRRTMTTFDPVTQSGKLKLFLESVLNLLPSDSALSFKKIQGDKLGDNQCYIITHLPDYATLDESFIKSYNIMELSDIDQRIMVFTPPNGHAVSTHHRNQRYVIEAIPELVQNPVGKIGSMIRNGISDLAERYVKDKPQVVSVRFVQPVSTESHSESEATLRELFYSIQGKPRRLDIGVRYGLTSSPEHIVFVFSGNDRGYANTGFTYAYKDGRAQPEFLAHTDSDGIVFGGYYTLAAGKAFKETTKTTPSVEKSEKTTP